MDGDNYLPNVKNQLYATIIGELEYLLDNFKKKNCNFEQNIQMTSL